MQSLAAAEGFDVRGDLVHCLNTSFIPAMMYQLFFIPTRKETGGDGECLLIVWNRPFMRLIESSIHCPQMAGC